MAGCVRLEDVDLGVLFGAFGDWLGLAIKVHCGVVVVGVGSLHRDLFALGHHDCTHQIVHDVRRLVYQNGVNAQDDTLGIGGNIHQFILSCVDVHAARRLFMVFQNRRRAGFAHLPLPPGTLEISVRYRVGRSQIQRRLPGESAGATLWESVPHLACRARAAMR